MSLFPFRNGVCGQQSLVLTDGDVVLNITCDDNSLQGISVQGTSTNYVILRMVNTEQEPGGKFWLGFSGQYYLYY